MPADRTYPAQTESVYLAVKISIVIVSYNVRVLLLDCLHSLQASGFGPLEIFVVDNASTDGSVESVRQNFPSVSLIANKENLGFAKANNQALQKASGEYLLFLNPDTVVPADALQRFVAFMDDHPEAGAAGPRMVNGKGDYLPESKRGLPTPMTAFWKLSGVSKLFPRSARFARYYLGHLDPLGVHEVEVLSGAFFFVRKSVLDRTGGFDERFFMYAEDIDLSQRIRLAGYRNYYLGDCTVLHYKGESTRKDRKYVRQFYGAMSQYVHKYYGRSLYRLLLDAGIWLRASLEMLRPGRR